MTNELATIRDQGYVVLEGVLGPHDLDELRAEVKPHLRDHGVGRNNFEGYATERIYTLVGKGDALARLAAHPRITSLCDALLEPSYLLTASQAICIHPGETPQPWHVDDGFYSVARPRAAISVSTIWAIDAFTPDNGATQIVPGSHSWPDRAIEDLVAELARQFTEGPSDRKPRPASSPPAAVAAGMADVTMSAGSVIVFVGTLLHRGGENQSAAPRLAISNQYCQPWARQQENFLLGISREQARRLPERVQQLIGYSIHPPFMGHVGGVHPARLLE